ncbi:MAG TPA: hypothetical protein VFZ09_18945 [Archangium sp.]|uniref:hypothetical protein n=1 Tax=Archangium sp. TaxID=1872627 RepID=UPI002E306774|nr:hypothetical protein [Archangium sp.]HEX5748325.1 hypothetical protein [Archangium sp.]
MSQSRRRRKNPTPPPPKRASAISIWAVVALVAGGVLVGVLINDLRQDGQPARPAATSRAQAQGPFQLEGELAEYWKAATARWCPRMATLQGGDAGQLGELTVELTSIQCIARMCEHSEKLEGVDPAALGKVKRMCGQVELMFEGQLAALTEHYGRICPELIQTWSGRPWSPNNHLGLYADVRQCMERHCEEVDGGMGSEARCEIAADLAEVFGDAQAAARLRGRARLAKARENQLWGPLSEEEKKEEREDAGMKVIARRLLALCRQGNPRYCASLARYCEIEGNPPDVCPAPGTSDAGSR